MLPLSFCRIDEPHSPGYNEIQQKGSAALWIVSSALFSPPVCFPDQKCFGPGVSQLLKRVDELHSLRAAALSMSMAYSKAWTVVRNAEDGLGFHLLTSTAGGKHGGGAVLTDEARQMLTAYDEYCEKLRAYGEKLFEETFAFYDDIPKQEVHKKEERYAR